MAERPTLLNGDAPEYARLPGQVARMAKRPIRISMNAGTMEIRTQAHDIISRLQSNPSMRGVLIAKGYDLTYSDYAGGHDFSWWRGLLADRLIALIGNREFGWVAQLAWVEANRTVYVHILVMNAAQFSR